MSMRYDPRRHDIRPAGSAATEVAGRLSRDISSMTAYGWFVYRHRETENFVAGRWLDAGHTVMQEVMSLGKDPRINSDQWRELLARISSLRPDARRDLRKHLASERSAKMRQYDDEYRPLTESRRDIRKGKVQVSFAGAGQ